MGKKKCFIVTDSFLYKNGYVAPIDAISSMSWAFSTPRFFDVAPDPTLACAKEGAQAMRAV